MELTSLIREFFQDLSKSLASRDIKKRVSTAYDSHKYAFYSYLKFLQENNYINKIPKVYHPKTTKTKSYRGLSTEEVELILEYFENRFSSKELQGLSFMKRRQFLIDRLLFFLAIDTGARRENLLGFRIGDFHFYDEDKCRVNFVVKNSKNHSVELNTRTVRALRSFMNWFRRKGPDDLLFRSRRGSILGHNYIDGFSRRIISGVVACR